MTNKLLFIALVALFIVYGISNSTFIKKNQQVITPTIILTPTPRPGDLVVQRVIDGDTIELNTGEKVRYIGINTPELNDKRNKVECFAVEAFQANKALVEGKVVRLEKDISNVDKYGRLLRYVYIADPSYVLSPSSKIKEIFINEYLVAHGFAQVASYPPDIKFQKIFLTSQSAAKTQLIGLWRTCPH